MYAGGGRLSSSEHIEPPGIVKNIEGQRKKNGRNYSAQNFSFHPPSPKRKESLDDFSTNKNAYRANKENLINECFFSTGEEIIQQ